MSKKQQQHQQIVPGNALAVKVIGSSREDLAQALKWTNEYLAIGNNSNQYWNVYLKAQIQKALGDKKGVEASAKASMELATKAKNTAYIKINEELIKSLK